VNAVGPGVRARRDEGHRGHDREQGEAGDAPGTRHGLPARGGPSGGGPRGLGRARPAAELVPGRRPGGLRGRRPRLVAAGLEAELGLGLRAGTPRWPCGRGPGNGVDSSRRAAGGRLRSDGGNAGTRRHGRACRRGLRLRRAPHARRRTIHDGHATAQRRGRHRHGGELAGRRRLEARMQPLRRGREAVGQAGDHGLIDANERPGGRVPGPAGNAPECERAHGHDSPERVGHTPEVRQAGPAAGAVAQVRADGEQVVRRGLAVGDHRQHIAPAIALRARLDPGVAGEEAPAALGEAAVDLCFT
jgi:hypothetical protein